MQRSIPLARTAALLAAISVLAAPLRSQEPEYPGRDRRGSPGGGSGVSTGFEASGVSLLSWLPQSEFTPAQNTGNDCWGYTSPSGREYAMMGFSDGTAFVEITDPGRPQILTLQSGPNSLWRDVKIYQTYAYVVTEGIGAGIQVFDLGAIDSGVVTLVNTIQSGVPSTTESHNIIIDEDSGYLYRLGGGPTGNNVGMRIYDLNVDPTAPTYVANWLDAYIHDAQVVTFPSGPNAGRQIVFACTDGNFTPGLDIIDVTNKGNIQNLSRIVYSAPGSAFSHQVWLTPDLQTAILNDEFDENGLFPTTNYVIDVSDLDTPNEIATFTNSNTAITHNLYVRGDYVYQANYSSGLRVFDSSNLLNIQEIAWFDTFPDNDGAAYDSLWSVYPFFPSGVVIGSDMQKGLFVWWVGAPRLQFDFVAGVPELIDPAGGSLQVDVLEETAGLLDGSSPKLHYDIGGLGEISVPLTPSGGNSYTVDFPALTCGSGVEWYLSAKTSDGQTWTAPEGGGRFVIRSTAAVGEIEVFADAAETNNGWGLGVTGDTATTGLWVRGDPIGTGIQPEDDNTPSPGTQCYFTGQGSLGGTIGENDIDGGTTTLLTPALDLTGMSNPTIRYVRWYKNDGNGSVDDVMRVDVSDDDGQSWTNVEILGPSDTDSVGGWIEHSFLVTGLVSATSTVRVRFVAEDSGSGSIVEAAIDDFGVDELICDSPTTYCTGKTSSTGCVPFVSSTGFASASSTQPFQVRGNDHEAGSGGVLVYGYSKSNLNFHGGKLCVKSPIRTAGKVAKTKAAAACTLVSSTGRLTSNFNNRIQSGIDPLLTAGQTVFGQWQQRDPANTLGGFADNLSNGIRFTINP